jgi:hypothetical protein
MAKGSAALTAEPRSPAPKTWVIRAEYRGEMGQIPETPPGVPTGFGLAASGGMLPRLASGQRGSGGTCCPARVNHLVARQSQEVQVGGTRYRIRFRAGRGLYSRPYADCSAFHRALPAVPR